MEFEYQKEFDLTETFGKHTPILSRMSVFSSFGFDGNQAVRIERRHLR